ncbi:MAG TPA: DnaA/Hda family protein [Pirellulaceae bacterium]|nr:DnaA/Hda family protein [Pirellulaceae bacterium]
MAQAIDQADDTAMLRRIRERLANVLGKRIYDMWFASPQRLQFRNGQLVIRGASDFEVTRIRRNYSEDVLAVLRELSLPSSSLEFEVNELRSPADRAQSDEPFQLQATLSPVSAESTPSHPVEPQASHSLRRSSKSLAEFCFGQENELVRTAIDQLIAQPGRCSPLILVGPTGCGKTHLLEGLVSNMRQKSKFGRCAYLTAEDFTNSFVEGLRGSGLPTFRRTYRDLQLLALDDFHFLASKRATLTEFQYTLDHLIRHGKQVVIALDRPLIEIPGLGDELLTRLTCGLVCTLAAPDAAVRRELIERGACQRQLDLPEEIVAFLAANLPGDVRRLQGVLNRLQAWKLCRRQPPSLSQTRELVRDLMLVPAAGSTLVRIEKAVCDCCSVDSEELRSENRSRRIASARMLAMWLSRRHTSNALADIGRYFGGRSHSAVIAAQKKIESWLKSEDDSLFAGTEGSLREAIQRIEQRLKIG